MANTNSPPLEVLEEVARQLRARLILDQDSPQPIFSFDSLRERGSPLTSTVELGATLELWRLSPAAVEDSKPGESKLAKLAKPVGFHHQVKLDDDSVGFARSSQSKLDDGDWSVDEIFVSDLAEKINKAIDWANEHVPDKKIARFLTAPGFQIEALWFVDEAENASDGDVFIVRSPPKLERLKPFELIPAEQFLEVLRDATPGMGLTHTAKRKSDRSR